MNDIPENAGCVSLELTFRPTAPAAMREAVEQLFFFNGRQGLLKEEIRQTVEASGMPRIAGKDDQLWIETSGEATQCLFAFDTLTDPDRPVGVVLYGREGIETLVIWHLAVDEVHTAKQDPERGGVGVALVDKVREIGRRIHGVRRVELPYRRGRFLPV